MICVKFDSIADRDRFIRGVVGCAIYRKPPENARWCEVVISEKRARRNDDRVILIGQAPSRIGRPDRPLVGGRSGEFLRELTGLTLRQYARRFERRNLLAVFPGSAPSGDVFPSHEASEAAKQMIWELSGRRVVMVGIAVARAFKVDYNDLFEWVDDPRGFKFSVIPHPSGVNRYWNAPGAKALAMGFFARLLRDEVTTVNDEANV